MTKGNRERVAMDNNYPLLLTTQSKPLRVRKCVGILNALSYVIKRPLDSLPRRSPCQH